MTLEDDIHENETQLLFTTSLRPDNEPMCRKENTVTIKHDEPSFYADDMKKWTESKFKNAQKARSEYK